MIINVCVCVYVSMSVLHYIKDVEYVGLVLQRRTLFELPHQRCKVCVPLRVSGQVQVSSTVGLEREVGVRLNTLHSNTDVTREEVSTLCCFVCGPC